MMTVIHIISNGLTVIGFLTMIGMLIQWPTIITALMFPVLVFIYYRLARREEEEMIRTFGDEYKQYLEKVPMFIPRGLSEKAREEGG